MNGSRVGTLSPEQRRLWLLQNLAPESSAYNATFALRLRGPLHRDLLAQTISDVVDRHDVLRTRIVMTDGEPTAIVDPPLPMSLPVSSVAEARDPEVAASRAIADLSRRPFQLAIETPFRPLLLELGSDDHALAFCVHHVAFDAGSFAVLCQELVSGYDARLGGPPPGPPGSPSPFADHSSARQDATATEAEDERFWRAFLAGVPPISSLRTDPSCALSPRFLTETCALRLDPDLIAAVRRLAKDEDESLLGVLLATTYAVLHRYTDESVIVVGSNLTLRRRPGLERSIGCHVVTLPVPVVVSRGLSFRELLRRVRVARRAAFSHPHCPLDRLVQGPRVYGRNPLYQVVVQRLLPLPRFSFARSPLEVGPLTVGQEPTYLNYRIKPATDLDLTMTFDDDARGGLVGSLDYRSDLFERRSIERLRGHFLRLLVDACAAPDERISDLPLLTEAEESQLLACEGSPSAGGSRRIHELIEAQVDRTPDAVAVAFGDSALSYRDLDQRGNRLAEELRGWGVRIGDPVPVFVDRSIDMLLAVLAVLKAGGCYLPLDVHYPRERLGYMLSHARAPLVLAQAVLRPLLPSTRAKVVLVDGAALSAQPVRLSQASTADDLAYVIYTSGSTGRPKGVLVPHRGVVNVLESMKEEPGVGPRDVFAAVTTLSFDIAALELFLPLAVGARVVILSRETATAGEELRATLELSRATVMQATPVTWRLLLASGWSGELRGLCGGEELSRELGNDLLRAGISLWNIYGPTETTIWSTLERVAPSPAGITIGRPIANTHACVLGTSRERLPVGVPGELFIGGAGVARGYLHQPDLTAERFVPGPAGSGVGARSYGTGDLVRRLDCGSLEFLGRADSQVKIRGLRIELGEIEVTLERHPRVREAAVTVIGDDPVHRRLVAYVVPRDAGPLDDLRSFVSKRLPHFMVPESFTLLPELPRLVNGKLDRRSLPGRDPVGPTGAPAARAGPQERVANLFAEALRVEQVGYRDDFFVLGGESFVATQLLSRVRKSFGVEVSLQRFFEEPTVEGLSKMITRALDSTSLVRSTQAVDPASLRDRVQSLSERELDELIRTLKRGSAEDPQVGGSA